MAQQIRLTEQQLNEMVAECVNEILNEGAGWDMLKGAFQGIRDVNRANRADRQAVRTAQKDEKQAQKSFNNYMSQAEKDIQAIEKILSHYEGQPNSGNIVDKAKRLIGAIRPKDASKADNRSYYSGMQGKVSQSKQNTDTATQTAKRNKQQRQQNVQQGMRNLFGGQQQQQYAQTAE